MHWIFDTDELVAVREVLHWVIFQDESSLSYASSLKSGALVKALAKIEKELERREA